jgi:FkbM family methyltransferase
MNITSVEKNGISFNVALNNYADFWSDTENRAWDELPLAILDHYTEKNSVIIDIGAWIGATSLYTANRASKILAFEPDPVAYQALKENIESNPILAKKIFLHNAAMTPDGGKIKLHTRFDLGDAGGSILPTIHGIGDFIEVESFKFDEFVKANDLNKIDLIKIDIEAGEYFLIPTMFEALRALANTPHLCIELHYSKLLEYYYKKLKDNIKPRLLSRGISFLDRKLGLNLIDKRAKNEADRQIKSLISEFKKIYQFAYSAEGRLLQWEELIGYLGNIVITNKEWK